MIGRSTSSTVPGTSVDRNTNTCVAVFSRIAAPRSWASRSIAVWSWLPFGADGVPTQISETSVASTACRVSRLTETRPLATVSAISCTIPSSTTGVRPAAIRSSFAWSTSTPTTRWPSRARQASETAPT